MYAMFGKMVAFHFRELAFFYPDFVAPTIVQKRKKKRLQRTLALIRPDALRTRKGNLAQEATERKIISLQPSKLKFLVSGHLATNSNWV